MTGSAIALFMVATLIITSPVQARIVHREQSLYQTILVDDTGSRRCLLFSIRRDQRNQSCIDLRNTRRMVFTYIQMMMAGLLLAPDPQRVLVIGLGGGTLPLALNELFPEALIDVVEIDAVVVRIAEEYFGFQRNEHINVFVTDGRIFTKRAVMRREHYDLIILDAFNGDYIPEHLMTREFLQETRILLGTNGTLVANTFSQSRLYDHESVTYESVFGDYFNFKQYPSSNRIILVSMAGLPDLDVLHRRAQQWRKRLRAYRIPIHNYPDHMSRTPDWDRDARVLTDQYAPANLLRSRNR
ncbi:MAG: fused MFS/spermidine synthase [Pseudomonadales bacterium]